MRWFGLGVFACRGRVVYTDAMERGVVISGMGAVSPNGVGAARFASALRRGESGVSWLTDEERGLGEGAGMNGTSRGVKSVVGGVCRGWEGGAVVGEGEARRLPRLVPMAIAAAREAVEMAGLGEVLAGEGARRVGVVLGTGAGGIDFTLDQAVNAYGAGGDVGGRRGLSLWTITNATHGNLAGELSIALGARGPSVCVSDGCASSSDAVGVAMGMLRDGARRDVDGVDAVVVVGADAHVRWETLLGMELLGVISSRDARGEGLEAGEVSRPFDAGRDGFVLGEGAWAVVLERDGVERERRVLGELMGYGVTCDAYHRVRPDPEMGESVRAMRAAVSDAGLEMGDVEVLHYHGTGTEMNDRVETLAVERAFGGHAERLRGHSVKSLIGHPQGASGVAALVSTLACLVNLDGDASGGCVFPTINLEKAGEGCGLDYTAREGVAARGDEVFMVNCLAFGAKNSVLVGRACGG